MGVCFIVTTQPNSVASALQTKLVVCVVYYEHHGRKTRAMVMVSRMNPTGVVTISQKLHRASRFLNRWYQLVVDNFWEY